MAHNEGVFLFLPIRDVSVLLVLLINGPRSIQVDVFTFEMSAVR